LNQPLSINVPNATPGRFFLVSGRPLAEGQGMSTVPSLDLVPGHGAAPIAVHRLGSGPPVVMIHGLASSAQVNWIRYGHAAALAAAGFEAVMLDLRAHGQSAAPHDPAAYPHDVAVLDIEAVLATLDLGPIDLVGYSLGSRMSVKLVARGLTPRRLILGGMGFETLTRWIPRRDQFLTMFDRFETSKIGDEDYLSIQFMKTMKADPIAMRLLLESTSDIAPELLDAATMPTLILAGSEDAEVGSPQLLAEKMPNAQFNYVPGNHMSCVTKPELGQAIAAYLAT
jgi:pimeloyl-ACP methyl ester carboxylesterase